MSIKRFGGQFRIVVSGIVLVVILVLVLLQWPMRAKYWLYVEQESTTLLVVVVSGLLALLFVWMAKVLARGTRALRETRDSMRLENLEKQAAQSQKNGKPKAPDSGKPPQKSA